MIRTVPITAVQAAVYKTLNKCLEGYPILDDSTPFEDGKPPASEFCVIGPISTVPDGGKTDVALWNCTVTIDVYSDYCGKKIINQMLDEIVTVLTMTAESDALIIENYNLINIADFNSLIAQSQLHNTHVFLLTQEQIEKSGKVWTNMKKNRDDFKNTFTDFANRIIRVTN